MKLRVPNFPDAHVLVVGDLMLDRYWLGDAARVSPEAPVPVVDVESIDERPGGAANVALNIVSLGARCTLVGVIGDDEPGRTLEAKLVAAGVQCELLRMPDWSTIVKLRVVSHRQQLLRVDFERPLGAAHAAQLELLVDRHLQSADVLVLEDYDKGTLTDTQRLIAAAKAQGTPVVVDPKFKPFSAWRGADLVKPNRIEFERAAGNWHDFADLVQRGAALADTHDIGALVITRGIDGLTLINRNGEHHHMPARSVDVFDETGAGDTVAGTLGATLGAGCSLDVCAALANIAAGIAVSKFGNAMVTAPELQRAVQLAQQGDRGVLNQAELRDAVEAARAGSQRVVFTNGCFDILHAGHVGYLEEARALGDRLIVAVNDDASVARLKGAGRPVNSLERRVKVLAGLAAVDWVVGFSDDTPEALLRQLQPDVLVKGGDYAVDQVVGADIVHGYGGDVRVLGLVDNLSTSAIVERLQRPR